MMNGVNLFLLIVFFPLLLLGSLLQAQHESPYFPTAVEGANWVLHKSETVYLPYQTFLQTIDGDTVISGTTYKKLYEHTIDFRYTENEPFASPPYAVFPDRRLVALLRDDVSQKKVYGMVKGGLITNYTFSPDTLLHDYSLGVGDTLTGFKFGKGINTSLVVLETGIEDRFGAERRFQKDNNFQFYEGVGSMEFGAVSGGARSQVACCAEFLQDHCVGEFQDCNLIVSPVTELSRDISIKIYPNPVLDGKLKIAGEFIRGSGVVIVRRMDGSIFSTLTFSATEELTIDAPEVTGIYFIQITKGEETAVAKVIVK